MRRCRIHKGIILVVMRFVVELIAEAGIEEIIRVVVLVVQEESREGNDFLLNVVWRVVLKWVSLRYKIDVLEVIP